MAIKLLNGGSFLRLFSLPVAAGVAPMVFQRGQNGQPIANHKTTLGWL